MGEFDIDGLDGSALDSGDISAGGSSFGDTLSSLEGVLTGAANTYGSINGATPQPATTLPAATTQPTTYLYLGLGLIAVILLLK